MERGAYKVSEETCRRLVTAAGELFACHGVEGVTVRDITRRAGTKPNAISYHFGGKEQLVEAVWSHVLSRWDDHRLERYCTENERLFATRDGQRQVVTDAVNLIYGSIYTGERPMWENLFWLRSVLMAQGLERNKQVLGEQYFGMLCWIFRRISGNDDRMSGVCWALNILAPGSYLTASATDFLTFTHTDKIDYAFCRRLQETVTRNALFSLGLA